METVKLTFKDHIAVVQLNRPKAHAINMEMAQDLIEAIAKLTEADWVQGVILTGSGNIFSAGLDIVELYGYDQDTLDRFLEAFHNLVVDLASFPKPLVAAINGHAPAGGCVFALCCDYRIMADGKFRIGLNEVPVGLVVPKPVMELARFAVGNRRAAQMTLNGLLMDPHEALSMGVIDDIAPAEDVIPRAEAKIDSWLAFSREAWLHTKKYAREPLLKALDMPMREGYGDLIREWWSPNSRAFVKKTIETMKAKAPAG